MLKKLLYLLLGLLFGLWLGHTVQQASAFGFTSVAEKARAEASSSIPRPFLEDSSMVPLSGYSAYQLTLKELGSPYWDVDIQGHCEAAQLTWTQCTVLLGIAGSESGHGTNFVKTVKGKGRVKDIEGGLTRHNPVGMKSPSTLPKQPIPDCSPDGCWWIYKFDSWEAFWAWYPKHMSKTYLRNGNASPKSMVKNYVGRYSQGWIDRVQYSMQLFATP